jgi:hypothetical protein
MDEDIGCEMKEVRTEGDWKGVGSGNYLAVGEEKRWRIRLRIMIGR